MSIRSNNFEISCCDLCPSSYVYHMCFGCFKLKISVRRPHHHHNHKQQQQHQFDRCNDSCRNPRHTYIKEVHYTIKDCQTNALTLN
ncbi:hypothetical protein DERP_001261 [Dermatophagoides pteronyssinus]|uniref:Uncharacterized protein n=1 Tax=Dermatophagoides pteronyssinus TaxID=6956 RepID=A0ABQ8JDZ8_DERPT|nr:hypothetical protein DERP_001261 [Dermatophagoides pteronyssinus]